MKTETAPLALQVEIRHVFDAPVERVFAAWTDVNKFAAWVGSHECRNKRAQGKIGVGNTCRFEGESPRGQFAVDVKYLEIMPNSRLVFSWTPIKSCCSAAAVGDGETTATVSFRAIGAKTEVHLIHAGFASEPSCLAHNEGWTQSFESLAKSLA